ncbi:hypothetical protein CK203_065548 [Vitis vinifera]|uniref:Uncharacterized protein n=1 Tax=Vitis vinifera TaxID=29760 RepID=A0A438G8I3_VITVI|nr:hypothetical protein CK203_065548 [Vitis vinifera]
MVTLLLEVNLLQMMLKGHGNDHNSNDPCILCKCVSIRYTLLQPAQNDPRLSLYKRVGSFWNHLEMSTHLYMRMEDNGRLKVNLDKNELIPMGNVENGEELASELGCKVGSLPSTYLGMSLGAPFKSVAVWDGVEERFWPPLQMELALLIGRHLGAKF